MLRKGAIPEGECRLHVLLGGEWCKVINVSNQVGVGDKQRGDSVSEASKCPTEVGGGFL